MAIGLNPLMENVPLIGRAPMRVAEAFIMANVTCSCRPANGPMLIRGTDVIVTCRWCGNKYAIATAQYDRDAGDQAPIIEVGQMSITR